MIRIVFAAALAGVTVDEAKQDRKANLRAGAALLSALAEEPRIDRTDLAAWLPVVGRATGFADPASQAEVARDDVFGALRAGVGVPLEGLRAATRTCDAASVVAGVFGSTPPSVSAVRRGPRKEKMSVSDRVASAMSIRLGSGKPHGLPPPLCGHQAPTR